MQTPERPSLQSPVVPCTLTIVALTPQGTTKKTTSHKNVKILLGRNEFRDIVLQMDGSKQSLKYRLKNMIMHKRFMKEGKATLHLKDINTNLMISNAPPNLLLCFLKTLATKSTNIVTEGVTIRQRLLSAAPSSFEEISPLTSKEYCGQRTPLREKNNIPGSSPVSSKRKRDDKSSPRTPKSARFLNPIKLNDEQKAVLQAVLSGNNVFFTGSAGTGKSFLLKRIVGVLPPDVTFVTASTGVAACQISGTTLHAFAGIGTGQASIEQCIQLGMRKVVALQWRRCKHLIIDEVSMIDGEYFEKMEKVARVVRGNDKPFGGIQLILCGDFLQLPPVTKRGEKRVFCFQSSVWDDCISRNMELTQVRRQDDQKFINILQALRFGRYDEEMISALKNTETNVVERDGIKATRLCTHRDDVDYINKDHLNKLAGESKSFYAVDSDPNKCLILDAQTPVLSVLILKVGAQVMLMKNLDVTQGLVNGARGVITGFSAGSQAYPIVRFVCGITQQIKHEKWTVKSGIGMFINRRQLPLKLAWAFSIHKSQGMTLDCVEMSLSRVFEAGQAYVALSRARNLKSIRLLDFNPSCVKAHPDVVQFYNNLRKCQEEKQSLIDPYI